MAGTGEVLVVFLIRSEMERVAQEKHVRGLSGICCVTVQTSPCSIWTPIPGVCGWC